MNMLIYKFFNKLKLQPELKLLLLVSAICSVLFGKYIFSDFVYIFTVSGSDTINSYYPTLYFNSRLFQDSFSWYSFNIGIGDSVLNNFLFDPFSFFLYMLPKNSLSSGIVYSIILKILFVAFFTYLYFKELLPGANEKIYWIGALAVSFSGFFILWGQHYSFSSSFAFFPLFLYGFELLMKGKSKWVYIIAIALSSRSLYTFYQIAIFSTLYFSVRISTHEGFDTFKKKLFFLFKLLIPLSIIGVALMAFYIVPSFLELKSSPRIHTEDINFFKFLVLHSQQFMGNFYFRLFSNNFLGSAENYFGFKNYYESPQLYSTLLILLIIPQALLTKHKNLLPLVILLLLFLIALFISPFLSFLINGMQYPIYRWGMLSSMAMVIVGVIGLHALFESITKQKLLILFATSLILLSVLFLGTLQFKNHNFNSKLIEIFIFMNMYFLIFLLFRNKSKILYSVLLFVLSFDIICENYPTINNRKVLKKNFEETGQLYFDGYFNILKSISRQDTSFFRVVKKSCSLFLNDSKIQNYNGLTSYNSVNDAYYIRFFKKANIPFWHPNGLNYMGQFDNRPVLYDLLSVKYFLGINESNAGNSNMKEGYYLLRDDYLPLGFTYNSFILENNIENYRDELLLKAVVLDKKPTINLTLYKNDKEQLSEPHVIEKQKVEIAVFDKLNIRRDSANSFVGMSNDPMFVFKDLKYPTAEKISIEFDLYAEKPCFSQLFHSYGKGGFSEALSDSRRVAEGNNHLLFELTPDFYSRTGIKEIRIDPINYAGNFKVENVVITYYKAVDAFFDSRVNQITNVPDKRDERTELYLLLKRDTLTITHFTPDNIKGNISVDENKILFLSIPFNKGWKIRLNGKKVEPMLANYGFIGVPLEKGSYLVELNFFPYGLKTGLYISLITLLLSLIYLLKNCSFFNRKVTKNKS